MQPATAPSVRSRFQDVFAGRMPADRLPCMEWASWWDKTIERWHGEGLPPELDKSGIKRHFGLDVDHQHWLWQVDDRAKRQEGAERGHDHAWITDEAGYDALRPYLYRQDRPFSGDESARWKEVCAERDAGGAVTWLTFSGFFWWPRVLLGIERHLYAFADQGGLMHRINQDQAEFMLRMIDQICAVGVPDFMTFAEDMSYNHGPMLSKRAFDTYLAPYYRMVIPELKRRGIAVLIDSDGDVTRLIPWLKSVGMEGLLPIERQAGCDIDRLQADHPDFVFIGHFDKMTMPHGEAAMRAEFERLLPAMRRGRFIPSVDHQTPPGVSLQQYHCYLALLREYTAKACLPGTPASRRLP